ncbi:MAG: M23 family metallopeptidase [Bacteroidia bacterium]
MQWSKLRKTLTTQYAFVGTNNQGTFHMQIRMTFWSLWIVGIGALLALFFLVWSVIAYTPLRHTIPGYPTLSYLRAQKQLIHQLEEAQVLLQQHTEFLQRVKQSLPPRAPSWEIKSRPESFSWPVDCPVSQRLQPSRRHWGIDLSCEEGKPILSPIEGTVCLVENGLYGGYTLAIQGTGGIMMIFKHLSRIFKSPGDKVQNGEVIALTGKSGSYSQGPHLHWEVWKNGQALDPTR